MFTASRHDIDSCRFYAAVPKDIREFRNVLFYFVEAARKLLSKIMRIHLCQENARAFGQLLHLSPEIAAVNGQPVSCPKDNSFCDSMPARIAEQFGTEFPWNEDRPAFLLAVDHNLSPPDSFNFKENSCMCASLTKGSMNHQLLFHNWLLSQFFSIIKG